MKNGDFVIYKGKEYEYYENMDKTIDIVSTHSEDLRLGFTASLGQYFKKLNVSEVESIYSIRTCGTYKGHDVAILNQQNDKYQIEGGGSEGVYEILGFEVIERGVYRKWVNRSDLEKEWVVKTLLYL